MVRILDLVRAGRARGYSARTRLRVEPSEINLPIEDLLTAFSHRISNLEHRIQRLADTEHRFAKLQTLLQMGETFKRLHRQLAQLSERKDIVTSRQIHTIIAHHKLTPQDLLSTIEVCKERNRAAHPDDEPDLTEADPELLRIYLSVQDLLEKAEKSNGGIS